MGGLLAARVLSPNDLIGMIRMATQFAPPALLRALKRG